MKKAPWGLILTAILSMIGAPLVYDPPAPVVVTTPAPAPGPKVDWLAILRTILANVPRVDPEPAPEPGLLSVAQLTEAGMTELRASGSFEKIAWTSKTPVRKYESDRVVNFVSPAGTYEFTVSAAAVVDGKAVLEVDEVVIQIGPPVVKPTTPDRPPVVQPDPTVRPNRATYVYESRKNSVPSPVSVAIDKLNRAGIVANKVDQNSLAGKGQIPVQFTVALEEARKAGIPCLVVEYTRGPPKVVSAPTTEAQVLEAVK